jgi:hypothetical protein
VKRIALVGPSAAALEGSLAQGGYEPHPVATREMTPESLGGFELYLLSPYGDDGEPLYGRFRELLGHRRAPVILVLADASEELPESWIAGINDIVFWPRGRQDLLAIVRRQLSVPKRREASTLARVRPAGAADRPLDLGCAVNVSLHGLLLEVQTDFGVGDALEIEFFLEDDPQPVAAFGVVRRATVDPERLRRAYGVEFTRLLGTGRERLARYCEGIG